MALFPSERWLDEYERLLSESAELATATSSLGSAFETEIMLVITDFPLETTTLGDLPANLRAESEDVTLAEFIAETDNTIRSSLPQEVCRRLDQFEETVFDGKAFVRLAIEEDDVEVTLMDEPGTYDVDSVFRASCSTWQQFVDGRPPLALFLAEDMSIRTAGFDQFRYAPVFQVLGEVAAEVETEHVYQSPSTTLPDLWFDQVVRHAPHEFFHRQSTLLYDAFTPF